MTADESLDLRHTQELFWTLITAPEGVRAAIDGLSGRGAIDEAAVNALFAGDARLPAVERLDIYANMYFYRLLDCLAEDFPKVRAAVGPAHFHNLVTDYLIRHPSEHPSLRFLGRRLPEFIRDHPPAGDFPFLADLARLEWARADVFDAADAVPLSRAALARLPQERAGESRFTLIPAFALLRLGHEVVRFWRALDEAGAGAAAGAADSSRAPDPASGAVTPPTRRSTAVRVWRKDLVVYHASLDEEEARCLELAQAGETLGRICQILAAGRSPAKATERAGRMIQTWLEDGILAGVGPGLPN
ncbi:MAG: DNA-binding domain-containing protein [Acidobacteriota bacterium]|mgnify:CR=1 FL=1